MTQSNGFDNGVIIDISGDVSSPEVFPIESSAQDAISMSQDDLAADEASSLDIAVPSTTDEDVRDALLAVDEPEDVDGDSGDSALGTAQGGEVPGADHMTQTSSSDLVLVKLDDIVIDNDTYSREEVSSFVVDDYVDAFRGGAVFPPPVLDKATEFADKKVVVDGGHRVTMYKRYRKNYPRFMEEYKKELRDLETEGSLGEPLPVCPPPPPDEILCRFVEKPKNIPLILFGFSFNKLHGARPRPQDRAKTARAAYLENRGIPFSTLASYLGASVKQVRSDIRKLVDEYEALKIAHLAVRGAEGATAAEIAAELAEKFPYGKGLSESTIARKLDEMREGFLGRPKKEKKPKKDVTKKDTPGNSPTSKNTANKGTPPYPPHPPAGKITGAGVPTGKSVTPSTGATGSPAPSPATTTVSADAKTPELKQDVAGVKGDPSPKTILSAVTPGSNMITADDGSLVKVGESGFSLFIDELKQAIAIIPHDLWDLGGCLASIFVNLLYFFTDIGDQVVVISATQHLDPVADGCLDRKIVLLGEDDAWPPEQTRLVFVNSSLPVASRPDPGLHLMLVRQTLKEAHENVGTARLALLCEEWLDDLGKPVTVIDYLDVVTKAGWTLTRCISAPRPLTIPEKSIVSALKKRALLASGCYVIIAEKEVPAIPAESASTTVSENDNNINSPETDSQTQTTE